MDEEIKKMKLYSKVFINNTVIEKIPGGWACYELKSKINGKT